MPAAPRAASLISQPFVRSVLPASTAVSRVWSNGYPRSRRDRHRRSRRRFPAFSDCGRTVPARSNFARCFDDRRAAGSLSRPAGCTCLPGGARLRPRSAPMRLPPHAVALGLDLHRLPEASRSAG